MDTFLKSNSLRNSLKAGPPGSSQEAVLSEEMTAPCVIAPEDLPVEQDGGRRQ